MVDISDEELAAARERGRIEDETEPRAGSARYDAKTGRVILELANGSTFLFPARLVQGLQDATDADLAELELWDDGYALSWEKLDVDIRVVGLLAGIFGTKKYMRELRARGRKPTLQDRSKKAAS